MIAHSIALAKRKLTGPELRFLREYVEFSAKDLGELVEYNEDTIRKIEKGTQTPKGPYEMFLRLAALKEMKAPNYDLHEMKDRKQYVFDDLKFRSTNKDREISNAA